MARKPGTRKPGKAPASGHEEKASPDGDSEAREIPGQISLEKSPFKLKGDLKYLSTDIDALYSYVKEKKSVKLSDATRKFKIGKELIEEWGSILEDHHMIEMHYPVTGEPTLRMPLPKGKSHRKVKKRKKKKKPKKGKSLHLRLTKKRIMIMAEIIVLGEILIYIFLVNTGLRDNFIPTLNYQISKLQSTMMNLPSVLSGSGSPINPLYLVIGILMVAVVLWMGVAFRRRKKKGKKPPESLERLAEKAK